MRWLHPGMGSSFGALTLEMTSNMLKEKPYSKESNAVNFLDMHPQMTLPRHLRKSMCDRETLDTLPNASSQ